MREVSVFGKNDIQQRPLLTRGAYAECSTEPDKEVKAYPKLKSKRPLYGKFQFDPDWSHGKSIEIHFVLDESGDASIPEEKKGQEAQLSPYDRLYIDLNRDLDLTNDPVLKRMKDPPWQALPPWKVKQRAAFEYVNIDVDYGPGLGVRPFRILPWLTVDEDEGQPHSTMHFVATAARQGRIHIGKHECDALLAQPYLVAGRFDLPVTALFLRPVDSNVNLEYGGFAVNMLIAVQRIDGQLYTFAATPLGDKLSVRTYRGDLGVFRVGPGGRNLKEVGFQGSLRSEAMAIALSPDRALPKQKQETVGEYKLPVGDYLPWHLWIRYGRLRIGTYNNCRSECVQYDYLRHAPIFAVKIRNDKPFVLDFSNEPTVIFTGPGREKTFKPGDTIKVAAELIDPVLDIRICRLVDTARKKKETIRFDDGKTATYERDLSLDPVVTITNSSGKKIAEGVMPFG